MGGAAARGTVRQVPEPPPVRREVSEEAIPEPRVEPEATIVERQPSSTTINHPVSGNVIETYGSPNRYSEFDAAGQQRLFDIDAGLNPFLGGNIDRHRYRSSHHLYASRDAKLEGWIEGNPSESKMAISRRHADRADALAAESNTNVLARVPETFQLDEAPGVPRTTTPLWTGDPAVIGSGERIPTPRWTQEVGPTRSRLWNETSLARETADSATQWNLRTTRLPRGLEQQIRMTAGKYVPEGGVKKGFQESFDESVDAVNDLIELRRQGKHTTRGFSSYYGKLRNLLARRLDMSAEEVDD